MGEGLDGTTKPRLLATKISAWQADNHSVEELIFIELNGAVIEMLSVKNPAPISKEKWQVGVRRFALEVEDIDKAVEYLESKGIEVSHREKSSIAEIKDPDGISVELLQKG